jgi:SAM-dependent methyltransferase
LEEFYKKLDDLVASPQFSNAATSEYVNFLREKVFLTHHKWPHFNLLLDDISSLAKKLPAGSVVVSLERGMLYGGVSILGPVFNAHRVISVDCSPESAESRGSYNSRLLDDARMLTVKSSIRANAGATGLPDQCADALIVPNLVHHVKDQEAMFREISRILKTSGTLYIFEPLIRELHQIPDDFLRYTPYGLSEKLNTVKISSETIRTEGGPFSVIAYCWAQALEYIPEAERNELNEWFYNEHFSELLELDNKYPNNVTRKHTEFPMAFSIFGKKL